MPDPAPGFRATVQRTQAVPVGTNGPSHCRLGLRTSFFFKQKKKTPSFPKFWRHSVCKTNRSRAAGREWGCRNSTHRERTRLGSEWRVWPEAHPLATGWTELGGAFTEHPGTGACGARLGIKAPPSPSPLGPGWRPCQAVLLRPLAKRPRWLDRGGERWQQRPGGHPPSPPSRS